MFEITEFDWSRKKIINVEKVNKLWLTTLANYVKAYARKFAKIYDKVRQGLRK